MRVKVNYLDNLQAGAGLWFRLLFSYETETAPSSGRFLHVQRFIRLLCLQTSVLTTAASSQESRRKLGNSSFKIKQLFPAFMFNARQKVHFFLSRLTLFTINQKPLAMFQPPFLGFVTLDAAVNIMTGFILKNHRWATRFFV